MIDIDEKHLVLVREILQKYAPGVPVWVFGSRVKGQAKPWSDLDLVIVDQQRIPQKSFYQIKDAFEESDLPWRVDVLDWHRISPSFRAVIQEKYEVL
jgi:predicted nucleotidyltransferase